LEIGLLRILTYDEPVSDLAADDPEEEAEEEGLGGVETGGEGGETRGGEGDQQERDQGGQHGGALVQCKQLDLLR
jgi:hypothetical protein